MSVILDVTGSLKPVHFKPSTTWSRPRFPATVHRHWHAHDQPGRGRSIGRINTVFSGLATTSDLRSSSHPGSPLASSRTDPPGRRFQTIPPRLRHPRTKSAVRAKHTAVADEVDARARNQRGAARQTNLQDSRSRRTQVTRRVAHKDVCHQSPTAERSHAYPIRRGRPCYHTQSPCCAHGAGPPDTVSSVGSS